MSEIAIVIVALLMVVVAPVWIVLHYITRWRSAKPLTTDDERLLSELWESAQKMEDRIHALERILDAEAPGWRHKG